jgi:hypothetical protein
LHNISPLSFNIFLVTIDACIIPQHPLIIINFFFFTMSLHVFPSSLSSLLSLLYFIILSSSLAFPKFGHFQT